MPIDFSQERWEIVKKNAQDWWDGKLGRPLIHLTLAGRSLRRAEAKLPKVSPETMYDLSVTPEEIVDRWDYDLSCQEFLGDSFPCVWPNFGPGVLAAFMGASPEPTDMTVWFHPDKDRESKDIRLAIILGNWHNFDKLVNQVGGTEQFVVFGAEPLDNRREVEAFLKRYKAM